MVPGWPSTELSTAAEKAPPEPQLIRVRPKYQTGPCAGLCGGLGYDQGEPSSGGEPRSKAATGRQTTDGLKGAVAQVVNESVAITRSGSARLEHAVFGIGRPRRSARR